MKFTKKEFKKAFRENNQTLIWALTAAKLGHTPKRSDIADAIIDNIDPKSQRAFNIMYKMVYGSKRKDKILNAENDFFKKKGGYAQFGDSHYRLLAIKMLKRLNDEPLSQYTKIPMFGANTLYFCSPSYGMKDYNKVRCCNIECNKDFCEKVVEIGNKIYNRKRYGR